MQYDIDLQTKLKGKELEDLWQALLRSLSAKFETIPVEERNKQHDELVDNWCGELAATLGLAYYRVGEDLNFCDKALAPN